MGRESSHLLLGVSVTGWVADAFQREAVVASLRRAAQAGYGAVAFSPTWYVSSTRGEDLAPRPLVTPNDALLLAALEAASELGLSTTLKPHVDVGNGSPWRGEITPSRPEAWWTRYSWMIEHYAALAQRAGVSTFVIGTELESLTGEAHETRWRALITAVRATFSGTVTYTTNELIDQERVRFWDALDAIGLSLYPTLAPAGEATPPRDTLIAAWQPHLAAMRALRRRWQRPLLIAEIGFRSAVGALHRPWDWERADERDDDRQAAAYEASYAVLSIEDDLQGVFWWDWPADLTHAGQDPSGYTPYGKAAAEVARSWNRRLSGRRSGPPQRTPLVSVVVPIRNGAKTVGACLESVLRQSWPGERTEVIAVDNASTDETAQILRLLPVRYTYEPRIGRSHARNRGVEAARGEVIAFTDADCIAGRDWISELMATFAGGEVDGVAGEILTCPPRTAAQRYAQAHYPSHQSVVLELSEPFAITANVAYRAEVFERIGGFDPAFVTAEDVDFGWRFFGAELRMAYAPGATVEHQTRATIWGLLRQQAGYGYGRAILRERYALRRGYALPTDKDIREAADRVLERRARDRAAMYDLGVMLALRAGELRRDLERVLPRRAAMT